MSYSLTSTRRLSARGLRLGLIGASALAIAISGPAWGQEAYPQTALPDKRALPETGDTAAASDDTDATVGEILVTGSRVRRKDADSVGALLTITSEDMSKSGVTSVGELLQKIPAAGVSLNSNGSQGTSFGASAVNLRYLGGSEGSGNRVLVLVDGHRWVDAVGQRGFRDFVDLNTMPMGMIDGIEVLKDGASAIYGADAIAGVVNIKTVQPFDGIRGSVKAGVSSHGDGAEYSGQLTVGKTWDRFSVIVSGSYFKAEPILNSARSRTAFTLVPVTAPPSSPNGLYSLPGLSNNAFFGTPTGFASSAAPIAYNGNGIGAGNLADNSFHTAALPGDFYDTQPAGVYSAGPSERYGIYGRLDFELTDTVNLKLEGVYNHRTSDQLLSPFQLDIGGSGTGTATTARGFAIPNDQAFNPFGTANGVPLANAVGFSATQAWRIRRILTEVGRRNNLQDVETWRIAGGLDGTFQISGGEWNWDIYGSYSRNTMHNQNVGNVNYDALFLGLGSPATCAATQGCVPINLFGPLTPQQVDYISHVGKEMNYTELYDFTANLSGTLLELPAGPLGIAMGYEYRQNGAVDRPDPIGNLPSAVLPATNTTPRTSIQMRTPTSGSYDLHEVYGEASIPVFKDQPFAKSLDLSLAARYSRYSTVGGKATMKVGIGYRPVEDILLRGTWSQGFRAPSINELFQGSRNTNFQGSDPCNGGGAGLPGCAGVPTTYNQAAFNNGLFPGLTSGNQNLDPETAETISAGVAIKPSFIPGLSLTVDYYNIKVSDAIAAQSATQILQLCATQGGVFCDLVSRDASSGAITALRQAVQNFSSIKTDGVDATLRYDFNTDIGRFGLVLDATYLNSFETRSPNAAGGADIIDERAGKGDQPRSTYPHWKGQASANWSSGEVDAVVRARYIGGTTDAFNAVKDDRTKSIIYTDAEVGFGIGDGRYRLTVGVNNVFDVQPPASFANAPINYDIYTYDARGRFLYVRAAIKM